MDIKDIIRGCQKRDRVAQNALYSLYSGKMNALCYLYTGSRDDAKDVLHDGFIKVFDQINSFSDTGSFEGWVRRIMVNTAINFLRRRKKIVFSGLETDQVENIVSDPEDETELDKFKNLSQNEILGAIQKLKDESRVIFTMSCFDDYSHKEISEILNIKETTSRSKLKRAREALRENLQQMSLQKP